MTSKAGGCMSCESTGPSRCQSSGAECHSAVAAAERSFVILASASRAVGEFAMLLKCLSIQQPFADLILSGRKRVENRSWTWMKERDWTAEGPILLGIHASTRMASLSEEELDDYVPGWRDGAETDIGSVIGVVQLTHICRAKDLPPNLRKHDFVNADPDNWCWILANPQRLTKPYPATGNARLFNVDVPGRLLPQAAREQASSPRPKAR